MAFPHPKPMAKHPRINELICTKEDIRWATPWEVATYIAGRLRCNMIADVSCGIGFQSFAFAATCKKVYAIDTDKEKVERAKQNAAILGLNNIEFIHGDALDPSVIKKLNVDVVFSDPQRPASEDARKVESIQPAIPDLLKAYGTDAIAIAFPPQIRDIPFDCEREYASLNGKLNRLTLYFGKLKQHDISVVALPGGAVLAGKAKELKISPLKKFLYQVNPAVVRAGLTGVLATKLKLSLFSEEKYTYLTSDTEVSSPFLSKFKVVARCKFLEGQIGYLLKKYQAGKVELRFSIASEEYWKMRNALEQDLTGKETIYLFKKDDEAILARGM